MIHLGENLRLQEVLCREDRFSFGVELVSTRGTMTQKQSLKARALAEHLTYSDAVDWVSITDNAGGNPQMAPIALGTPILYAGKEVVVHLTCKDLNRHGLESLLWMYASQGFHNILALTGDYPMSGAEGLAKPVFDIDSIGLLQMIERMNEGLEVSAASPRRPAKKLDGTFFFAGAVCTPFKAEENTLMPQYYKLEKKIAQGARFIISQIGYDFRKASELIAYMRHRGLTHIPLVGNVYRLSPYVAKLFHQQKIPGVVLRTEFNELCQKHGRSADKGSAFFLELAAKQMAIYEGLGYKGAYLGGIHEHRELEKILAIKNSFSSDDWKTFYREIDDSKAGDFYRFGADPETGLADPERSNLHSGDRSSKQISLNYKIAKFAHRLAFDNGKGLAPIGKRLCHKGPNQSEPPKWLRMIEHASKSMLFSCHDCGDCSLGETAFLCPESQCAKNMRNGPCGGTREGRCEVLDVACIWSRAYDRKKSEGSAEALLDAVPVLQDQSLRGSSSWANYWHGLDHTGKTQKTTPLVTPPTSNTSPSNHSKICIPQK